MCCVAKSAGLCVKCNIAWSERLKLKTRPPWPPDYFYTKTFISPAASLSVLLIHIFIPGLHFARKRWLVLRRLIILENFSDLKCNISRLQGQLCVLPSSSFLSPSQSIVSKELKRHVSTLESFSSSAGHGKTLVGTQAEEKPLSRFFLNPSADLRVRVSGCIGTGTRPPSPCAEPCALPPTCVSASCRVEKFSWRRMQIFGALFIKGWLQDWMRSNWLFHVSPAPSACWKPQQVKRLTLCNLYKCTKACCGQNA